MELTVKVTGETKAEVIRKLAEYIQELARDENAKPGPDVDPQWGGGGGP